MGEVRADWAVKHGQEGVLKLLELQDTLYRKELARLEFEAKTSVHDSIVDEWAAKNEGLFKDEELSAFAAAIEKQLLVKAGVNSYKELSPSGLKKHLSTVETKVREIGEKLGKIKPEKADKREEDETAMSAFRSVGDSAGVASSEGIERDITKLSGFEAESLPLSELKKLEQQLLQ
jgi:hypothetical protein